MMRRHATWNRPRSATFVLRFAIRNWRFHFKRHTQLRTLLLDFPATTVPRASSATETLTRLTNHTIRAGSLPKPLSASFGYLKDQTLPTKQLKLYHIFSFSTIPCALSNSFMPLSCRLVQNMVQYSQIQMENLL
jgi:hypothetical protein